MSNDRQQVKAPLIWLGLGYVAVAAVFTLGNVSKPEGIDSWSGYLVLWLASLAAYLVPFALFTVLDLKVQGSGGLYLSNPKSVNAVRIGLLLSGMGSSIYFVVFLAIELSKILNAGA